jgi:hypothetical protein
MSKPAPTVKFVSIDQPAQDGTVKVRGLFPAGLVRGVGEFEFSLVASAHDDYSACIVDFQVVRVNGVDLSGYLRLGPFYALATSGYATHIAMLRRIGEWGSASDAAYSSMRQVGDIIRDQMIHVEMVAKMVATNTAAHSRRRKAVLSRDIAKLEAELAEMVKERELIPNLDGAELDACGLVLVQTLIRDGVEYGEAFAAAAAIARP